MAWKGQLKVVAIHAYTSTKGIKCKLIRTDVHWMINASDFNTITTPGDEKLLSPFFDIETINKAPVRCQLAMGLNSSDVYVFLCSADVNQLKLMKTVFVVSIDGERKVFRPFFMTIGSEGEQWHSHSSRQHLFSSHLKDGKIEVRAEVIIGNDEPEDAALHQRLQTLADIFDRQDTGDFIIRCQGQDIRVHKVLLSGSPVLMAMLESNMSESKDNLLHITDFSFDVIWNMVKFLYSGILWDDGDLTSLFMAADKYQIDTLKDICIERLISSLDVDNCCEYLKLADDFEVDKLKEATVAFICAHYSEAMATSGWKTFIDLTLLTFLFKKACQLKTQYQ